MPLPRFVRACVRVRVRVCVRACVRRRSPGYSLHAIHLLHSKVGSRKTAPFQLASPLPATRGHTKALLQSVLEDKRSQRLRLVTLLAWPKTARAGGAMEYQSNVAFLLEIAASLARCETASWHPRAVQLWTMITRRILNRRPRTRRGRHGRGNATTALTLHQADRAYSPLHKWIRVTRLLLVKLAVSQPIFEHSCDHERDHE